MKHQRKIIALILIAYAGIFSIMVINGSNPVTYGLIVTILVTLILSLVYVTKSFNKERKDKDDSKA